MVQVRRAPGRAGWGMWCACCSCRTHCAHACPHARTRPHAAQVCLEVQAGSGRMLKDFTAALEGNARVAGLRARVEAFAEAFPMPGFGVPAGHA